ncbi:MAG: ABC transporter ATP-binding protein [Candidatus Aminicenantes bacterium]|nr:ABC transporter ATP-binding protein [Candidatus Aminicenantes bacterium]
MIEVQHLTKKYGDLLAVNDLNFKVEEGKIWGLLGPNAAGKTTTIRILTGYLSATDGKAVVAGFDIFEFPNDVKRIIGYLPENVPLYPEMTVWSYLDFVADIKQIPSTQKKGAVQKAIQTNGLESVQKRLIKNISRGFQQRVGLAQALIHDPKILILDEPTIALDPAQRIEILELIKSLKGEKTIILSTHLLTDVKQICDGMMIIDKGNLKGNGTLSELTEKFKKIEGISLKIKAPAEEAAPLLKTLAGEDNVHRQDDGFTIAWSKGQDLRDDITRLIVEKDLGLIEMKTEELSIEELYAKIISGGI